MRQLVDYISDGYRAYPITRALFDGIIATLRLDPRFRAVSTFDFELLPADARCDTEILLVRELRDRVHLDDIGEDI